MKKSKINTKDTALLVIDVINSCCHIECELQGWGISFKKIRKMVPRLKRLISKYKDAGD